MSTQGSPSVSMAEFNSFYFRDPAASTTELIRRAQDETNYPNPFVRVDFAAVAQAKAATEHDLITVAEASLLAGILSRKAGLESGIQQDKNALAYSALRQYRASASHIDSPTVPSAPKRRFWFGRRKLDITAQL